MQKFAWRGGARYHAGMKYFLLFGAVAVAAAAIIAMMVGGSGEAPETEAPPAGASASVSGAASPDTGSSAAAMPVAPASSSGKLVIQDIRPGAGKEAKAGNTVTVNYVGTLTDGTKFDSSYDRGAPFSFILGQNMVIQGWEQGLIGMKVGGKRKLVIPSSLGYGERGAGALIGPGATLVFEVEMLGVK